jgi:hypothetical protein
MTKQTVVKTYKGERALERGIAAMRREGYEPDQASSRKVLWSPVTGVFTRKQKHTVIFNRVAGAKANPKVAARIAKHDARIAGLTRADEPTTRLPLKH